MSRPTIASLTTIAALALSGATAAADSLPAVGSGHRPGPDALYAPPVDAPQLENTGPWKAPPILVSGATEYRDGEFLYQDFLHDDRGAAGVGDPSDPTSGGTLQWKGKAGTLTYPTDPVYANKWMLDYIGFTDDEVRQPGVRARIFH
ncbi:MAG: hypothetical protein ACJ76Z_16430, partial [Thermoleophilaceae bacterium]